ncbi:MAG: serine/threonine-protein kinase [Gemmataceae bacterium]
MNDRIVSDDTVAFQGATPIDLPAWVDSLRQLVLSSLQSVDAGDRLAWIRADQRQRWASGQRVPIEAYLSLPLMAESDGDLSIDLIYSEYLLRQERNERPDPEEYLRRFPRHADALRRLFLVDSALMAIGQGESPASSAAPPTEALPTIGRYVILDKLAEGGQGVVFRAVHPQLGREVAIKWSKERVGADGSRDRLVAEGKLLARIEHPRMVRVFDLDFHQERPFLVMELATGTTLEAYWDRVRPSPAEAASLAARIARAIDVLHRQGITHRDLKPKNILVDAAGEPKIVDFGLATQRHGFQSSESSDHVSGTLAYIPPEQAKGDEAAIGPRSDVYALGGVLHFLLTGKAPRQADDMRRMFDAAGRGEWDRSALAASNIAPALRRICETSLSVDANARFASASEFAEALDRWRLRAVRIRRAVLASMAILFACIAAGWLATRPHPSPIEPLTKGTQPVRTAPTKIEGVVYRKANGKGFDLKDALPIYTGNELRFTMTLPAHRHGAMLFYSEGKWTLAETYAAESTERTVSYPKSPADRVPLEGEPGTEVFVFVGSKNGPIDLGEIEGITRDLGRFPELRNDQTLLTFDEAKTQQWHRAVLGKAVQGKSPEDVAFAKLDAMRVSFLRIADTCGAVLFAHRSPDN